MSREELVDDLIDHHAQSDAPKLQEIVGDGSCEVVLSGGEERVLEQLREEDVKVFLCSL